MTSSLRLLPVLSTLFLLACGDSTGPGGRPDAGTPPAADSGQTSDAGPPPADGGTADGGATDAGTDGGTQQAPAAPTLTGTQPDTLGAELQPWVLGTAEPGVTLELFDSFLCWGDVLATGVAGEDGRFSIRFPADPNASVSISARARRGTRVSNCSADWLSYAHDGRAPTVQSVTPARDATGVSLTVAPSALFSESVLAASVKLDVTCAGQPVAGTLAVSGSRATFTPAASLPEETACTVTVREGADAAGNVLAAAYTWSFTTLRVPPPNPPTFTGTTPTSPGRSTTPSVQGRAPASHTVALFTTSDCTGSAVASGTATASGTFSLSVTVAANASTALRAQATDSGGRRSTCSPTSLTYVHDGVAPTVASVTPAPDAADVAADAPVRVTLSEPGKGTSSDFTVTCGGTRLSGTVAFSGTQVTFTPASALPLDVSCTATLAATAADLAGNPLAAAYSWSFTMKPSPPPATPTLTGLSPASPGRSTTPSVQGTAGAGVTVDVFTTSDCSGTAVASGTATAAGAFSIAVTVTANSTTSFHAQARSAVGRRSGCTAQGLTYTHDGVAPTVASLSPTADATEVDRGVVPSATFSERITGVASDFTLTCAGSAVAGTVAFAAEQVTFTPSARLGYSVACTARVARTVKDSAGNGLAEDVSWSFTTRAPAFGEPVTVGSAVSSGMPAVAMGNGVATLLWAESQNTASPLPLYRHQGTPSGGWSQGEVMNGPTDKPFNPQVAMSADGHGAAVWREKDGSWVQVFARLRAPDGTWSAPAKLTTFPSNASNAKVALDPTGSVVVATWVQQDRTSNGSFLVNAWSVWAARYTPATGWSAPRLMGPTQETREPVVAVDGQGRAMVVWRNWNGSNGTISASRHDGQGWSALMGIGTGHKPDLACGADGTCFVVYQGFDVSKLTDFVVGARYTPATGWSEPVKLQTSGLDVDTQQVVTDGKGGALALWTEGYGANAYNADAYASRYVPGAGWEAPVLVRTTNREQGSFLTDAAMDAAGNAVVLWSQYSTSSSLDMLYACRYVAGQGWRAPELLATGVDGGGWSTSGDVFVGPRVALDPSGAGVVAWRGSAGAILTRWLQ